MGKKIGNIAAILLACLIVSGTWQAQSFSKDSADFQFVVMTDLFNAEDKITPIKHFQDNIRRVNELKPDLTVIDGDLISGYEDDMGVVNKDWDAFDEACKTFRGPYYLVVGNHDVWNNASEDTWKRRNGKLYHSWQHKGCYFIALDSEVVGQRGEIAGTQLQWLKDELEKAKSARRIFVFLHNPLWKEERNGKETPDRWFRDVHPLLAKYGVDTVFAGHWHYYNLSPIKDGVRYVVTGTIGGRIRGYQLAGGFYHFLLVDVKDRASTFKIIAGEREFPADYVTDEKIKALDDSVVADLPEIASDRDAVFRLKVKNPLQKEARMAVRWDTKGTSWQADDRQIDIPAGQTCELDLKAHIGENIMPIPKAKVELMDGGDILYGWEFLSKVPSGLGDFVTEWNVAGPFDLGLAADKQADRKAIDEKFMTTKMKGWDGSVPPELRFDLGDTYDGIGNKKIGWEVLKANADGYLDIDRLYNNVVDYAVACAVVYVYSPEDKRYEMSVGSDDSIIVRVNGKEVLCRRVLRGPSPDQDAFEADLKKGRNEIFLKVADNWGGWGFYLRPVDPERSLRFSVE